MTSAKRVGNSGQVAYNTIEFAETGNNLVGLLGNHPLEVSDVNDDLSAWLTSPEEIGVNGPSDVYLAFTNLLMVSDAVRAK